MEGIKEEDREMEKFINECKKHQEFWKSIDIKIAAIKENEKWINWLTMVQLSGKKLQLKERVEAKDFIMLHQILDLNLDHLKELLRNLYKGALSIDNINIKYTFESPSFQYIDYHKNKFIGKRLFGINWGIYWLRRYEKPLDSDLREKIDEELKSYKRPYCNIRDALEDFFGKGEAFENPTTNMIAPFYVALRDSEFEEDMLSVEVESHKSIKSDELKLGWILYRGDDAKVRSQEEFRSNEIIEKGDNFYKFKKSITASDKTSSQFFLIMNEEPIDDGRALNPYISYNPKVVAHKLFDKDCEKLKRRLIERNEAEGDRQANYFEQAVMTLLYMCGFNTEWTDFFESEGLDIIAVLPGSQRVIAIQCTTGDIRKKITPTLNKTKELKELLKVFVIIPAIFTCIEISETNKKDVASEGIAVIDSSRIKEILRMANEGEPPEKVFDYIYGLRRDEGSRIAI